MCTVTWPANISMKLILQCSTGGSVVVDGATVGSISRGAVCLVGVHRDDTDADIDWMVEKLLTFKAFPGASGAPNECTIVDIGGDLLLVSQFTLYARLGSGRRPDFSHSMGNEKAREAFDKFVAKTRAAYSGGRIETGTFGAHMCVNIMNEGPVTYTFESSNK